MLSSFERELKRQTFLRQNFPSNMCKKILKILIITQEIMPTNLEFAYDYNQIDTYVLNGNI